ncbi:MAG: hypothetical protein QME61_03625 [Patescibacteria group bacterium]|nr:hypothetical protein [Patescibacteria group bacterium]
MEEIERERLEEITLRGTDLSEAAEEYWDEEKKRVSYQVKIIASAKWSLKKQIRKGCSEETGNLLTEFQEMLKKKRPSFEEALKKTKDAIEKQGELEKCQVYFDFLEMVKKKRAFQKIIDFIRPLLIESGEWSDWRETMYKAHLAKENEMKERIVKAISDDPIGNKVWGEWLQYVKGIGVVLTAQLFGIFEGALSPGETIGNHFRTVSQMNAYCGLDVKNGAAPKRKKGGKLTFNQMARAVIVGRLGTSLLKQRDSGYRRLYDQEKQRLTRRFEKEGIKILPSSKIKMEGGKEPEGVISELHLHRMAMRKMVKIFLSHFWEIVRKAEGLPAGKPYVIEVKGHPHYIPPITDISSELVNKPKRVR